VDDIELVGLWRRARLELFRWRRKADKLKSLEICLQPFKCTGIDNRRSHSRVGLHLRKRHNRKTGIALRPNLANRLDDVISASL
jgi:hypothetical protein